MRNSPLNRVRALIAACLALALTGCETAGYYGQAASGQLDLLVRSRSIDDLIEDPDVSPALRDRLEQVVEMRAFAVDALALPDNKSYQRYSDLERPYAVWTVFAAPAYSLEPLQWCYPVVGCVAYRGYFARESAERFAATLELKGYDVYSGGILAYSTLGWFPDPLLNTLVKLPDTALAGLLFHELAHQVVYVQDDTTFNESFATMVEREGVRHWLDAREGPAAVERYDREIRQRDEIIALILNGREALKNLYGSGLPEDEMAKRKGEILRRMQGDYRRLRESHGRNLGFDTWFESPINNAKMIAVATYNDDVPAFAAMFEASGRDFRAFYEAVAGLAALDANERRARLAAALEEAATSTL